MFTLKKQKWDENGDEEGIVRAHNVQTASEQNTRIWVLVLAAVSAFMVALDALVVATALTTIRRALGASMAELEWTVNAYTLSLAVLLLTGAALGDRFGRRRLFVIGLAIFTAASAACAIAPTAGLLIAARAIQGGGAALVMPLAVTQVSAAFPAEQRGRALGIFSGVAGLAVLAGPVVGGAITQGIAWEWIFGLNVPIGMIIIPLVLRHIPDSFGQRTPLDPVGLVLVTGATLGAVWGLVRGNSAGWDSIEVIAALAAGFGLAVAFVAWERRTRAPLLPMRLFRSRTFSAGNAAGFLFFASLNGAAFFLAQFLQTGLGYSPLGTGLGLLPWTAVLFVTAPLSGVLMRRIGERALMVGGMLLQAVALGWIGLVARPGLTYPELIAPLIIAGFGAAAIPASQNVVVGAVAMHEIGKASGTFNMFRQLGAAFGVALLAAVFAGTGSFGSAQGFSDGFAIAIGVSGLLSLLGAVAAMQLPGRHVAAVELVQAAA
jgi:EmrB/QacA subfamily drug resistance transporter